MERMANNSDLRRLIDSLPEDKKAALVAALEQSAGVTAEDISRVANDPSAMQKIQRLASQLDPQVLSSLASDPARLMALLSSPKVKNALKGLNN